jgi:hypothetical protein
MRYGANNASKNPHFSSVFVEEESCSRMTPFRSLVSGALPGRWQMEMGWVIQGWPSPDKRLEI